MIYIIIYANHRGERMTEKPFNLKINYENKGVKGLLEVIEQDGTLYVSATDEYPDGSKSELTYKTQRYNTDRILAKYNQVRRMTSKKDKHIAAVLMTILRGE